MRFCDECFKSKQIKDIIQSGNEKGNCELNPTHKNVFICDTNENEEITLYVKDFLRQIIELYEVVSELPDDFPSAKTKLIKDSLKNDWPIFEIESEKIYNLLSYLFDGNSDLDTRVLDSPVGIIEDMNTESHHLLISGNNDWDAFIEEITYENRFHQKLMNNKTLEHFISKSYDVIDPTDKKYFRSRISNDKNLELAEMSAPPKGKAKSGRLNSELISVLYLSDDIETTWQEVRAAFHDTVYTGTFGISKDKLIVANLCNDFQLRVFDNSKDEEYLKYYLNKNILEKITFELTKPTNEYTKSKNYIPLQYVSDFIKAHRLNFDGILYSSVMKKGKKNLLLFDPSLAKCIQLEKSTVKEVRYSASEIQSY
ncbi:RES domain-containing protein [Marinilactibacillus piezotolerans]|uniref:RES domain-containing protein n=2 Tax=Marinilactibacillus piezotolerans TaxID=258723 RepID=A0A1I4AIZ6_9LACT|nr:RES domain-containing protein [Marinilactibacillus piezotolerans]